MEPSGHKTLGMFCAALMVAWLATGGLLAKQSSSAGSAQKPAAHPAATHREAAPTRTAAHPSAGKTATAERASHSENATRTTAHLTKPGTPERRIADHRAPEPRASEHRTLENRTPERRTEERRTNLPAHSASAERKTPVRTASAEGKTPVRTTYHSTSHTYQHSTSTARYRRPVPLNGQQRLARLHLEPERVEQIQQALIREGYLQGDANGQWDARTHDAMMRYQTDHGFPATGLPEAKALMKLGLGSHPLPPELDHGLVGAAAPAPPTAAAPTASAPTASASTAAASDPASSPSSQVSSPPNPR